MSYSTWTPPPAEPPAWAEDDLSPRGGPVVDRPQPAPDHDHDPVDTPESEPVDAAEDPDDRPRRGFLLRRETRLGLVAALSFAILATLFVVNRNRGESARGPLVTAVPHPKRPDAPGDKPDPPAVDRDPEPHSPPAPMPAVAGGAATPAPGTIPAPAPAAIAPGPSEVADALADKDAQLVMNDAPPLPPETGPKKTEDRAPEPDKAPAPAPVAEAGPEKDAEPEKAGTPETPPPVVTPPDAPTAGSDAPKPPAPQPAPVGEPGPTDKPEGPAPTPTPSPNPNPNPAEPPPSTPIEPASATEPPKDPDKTPEKTPEKAAEAPPEMTPAANPPAAAPPAADVTAPTPAPAVAPAVPAAKTAPEAPSPAPQTQPEPPATPAAEGPKIAEADPAPVLPPPPSTVPAAPKSSGATPGVPPTPDPTPAPAPAPAHPDFAPATEPAPSPAKPDAEAKERAPAPAPAPTPAPAPATSKGPETWVSLPTAGTKRPPDDERGGNGRAAAVEPERVGRVAEGRDRVEPVPHVVQRGESFYTISRLYYGYGKFWYALWAANRGSVPAPEKLYVGQTIRIPPPEELDRSLILKVAADARPTSGKSKAPTPPVRTVSRPAAGNGADVDLPTGDPFERRKAEGDVAPDPETAPPVRARRPLHKVRPYETLRSIARDTLGDSRRADEILDLNADVIDDPAQLITGQVLKLPDDARPVRRSR